MGNQKFMEFKEKIHEFFDTSIHEIEHVLKIKIKLLFISHWRYLLIGGLNTILSLVLYYLFLKFGINYLMANTICFVIGLINGYYLNAFFVFKKIAKLNGLCKYSIVYLVSLVISLLLLFIFVQFFGFNKMAAQVMITAIITAINYMLIKKFVFAVTH